MPELPILTDRDALLRNRARALAADKPATFLHDQAMLDLQERLQLVNRTFTSPAVVTGFPKLWRDLVTGATIVADDDVLDLKVGAHDLVEHAMALHWANDPVGQMAQARRALKPDGLFLAVFFGGDTLKNYAMRWRRPKQQLPADLRRGWHRWGKSAIWVVYCKGPGLLCRSRILCRKP